MDMFVDRKPPAASAGSAKRRHVAVALAFMLLMGSPAFCSPLDDAQAAIDAGDYETARSLWLPLAQQGDALAQEKVGSLYHFGLGGEQDDEAAAAWYRKAADQGLAEAQYDLGLLYEQGRGVPRDPAEAARWFRRAAEQGNAKALGSLGAQYLVGSGVPEDAVAGLTLILLDRRLGDEIERDIADELLAQIERRQALSQQQRDRAAAAARQWQRGSPLPLP
jgi:TPR repeat protein